MNTHAFVKKLRGLKARFGLQLFVLAAVICTGWVVSDDAGAVYILTGPEDAAIVLNEEPQAAEGTLSSQLLHLSSGQSGYDMKLTAGQTVTVTHDGETVTAKARSETVEALLNAAPHHPQPPGDGGRGDSRSDGVALTIASELTYYDQVEEPAAYETVRVANPSLPEGTEKVVQEGADGVRTSIYEVVWSGGAGDLPPVRGGAGEHRRQQGDRVRHCGAVDVSGARRIASVSQKRRRQRHSDPDGRLHPELLRREVHDRHRLYRRSRRRGLHHRHRHRWCDVGTVAVDKSVIPLGTRMYIVAADGSVVYGTAVAEDTGVRGNIVDLYYDTYQQCINFGRRTCNVYILK